MFGFGKKKHPPASPVTVVPIAPPEPPVAASVVEKEHLAATDAKSPKIGLLSRLRERLRHDTPPIAPVVEMPTPVVELPPTVTTSVLEPAPPLPTAVTPPASSRILAAAQQIHENATTAPGGVLSNLRERLARTRAVLTADVGDLLRGRKEIDAALLEELETLLLTADVGVFATTRIIADLTARVQRHELARPAALVAALRDELRTLVLNSTAPVRQPQAGHPQVILMVGVNGVGKTTTIGKLARQLQLEGNRVMLAAGDTFRAAAVEQLQVWGERNQVAVISQAPGADPAAVIFDALQAATARGMDVLIADTAGRLHTKHNLMEELKKIVRVMKKLDPDAPHEVMLVVDATTGQNALHQAQEFNRIVPLTGITLTKLDGTAKGGVLFALVDALKVPIRFIGVGEAIEDLRYFQADEFLDALLAP